MQAALAKMVRGEAAPEGIAAGNERLSPSEQIDIYREQFFLRHRDALREDFLAVEHAIGEAAFDALCVRYLAAHPPSSFTLRDLGHALATFLSDDPFLRDIARVEWAFVEAFDAADAPPLDPATIVNATEAEWPGARIALHPSVQRLALDFPAHDYRQAVRKEEAATKPEPKKSFVVVYRAPDALRFTEIDPAAFWLLDEIANGATLAAACENAARKSEVDLARWFSQWTANGWVTAVTFSGPASGGS